MCYKSIFLLAIVIDIKIVKTITGFFINFI